MNRRACGRMAALLLALSAPQAWARTPPDWSASLPAGVYTLDPARARLTTRMRFWGLSSYALRFTGLSGSFLHDPARAANPQVTISVDPRSVDRPGEYAARRAVALLEPERYPTITFTAREFRSSDVGQTVVGDLSLHGVTRPVALALDHQRVSSEGARVGFSGSGQIRRSEFGMSNLRGMVGDRVELAFEVEFVRR